MLVSFEVVSFVQTDSENKCRFPLKIPYRVPFRFHCGFNVLLMPYDVNAF